jgi:hypothetical protein
VKISDDLDKLLDLDIIGNYDAFRSHLKGKPMMCCIGVARDMSPREKSEIISSPMASDFELDFIAVSTIDSTDKPVLFLHHEQFIDEMNGPGTGRKISATLVLCSYGRRMQSVLYPKRFYRKGETVNCGMFENTSEKSIRVTLGLVGKCIDDAGTVLKIPEEEKHP